MEFHPVEIKGNWYRGWALDLHSLSSKRVNIDGQDSFETEHTEIGQALYEWKYEGNTDGLTKIAEALETKLAKPKTIVAIIPIPPSKHRSDYRISDLTTRLGKHWGIDAPTDYLIKVKDTGRMRDTDEASRREALSGALLAIDNRYQGKDVLLFDDLYDTGSTLSEATKSLKNASVAKVYVMALTRTRRSLTS